MLRVLLLDDDPAEPVFVKRILDALIPDEFELKHALWCNEAVELLNERPFDLVLLDNRLRRRITAQITVPQLKAAKNVPPIVIISDDTDPLYLSDPSILGVDHVVDKANIVSFFKQLVSSLYDSNITSFLSQRTG